MLNVGTLHSVFHFSVVTGNLSDKDKLPFSPSTHPRDVRLYYACGGHNYGILTIWPSEQPVAIKNYIFWDITRCSPLEANRRFGGAFIFRVEK
jgi:hypothetical protein